MKPPVSPPPPPELVLGGLGLKAAGADAQTALARLGDAGEALQIRAAAPGFLAASSDAVAPTFFATPGFLSVAEAITVVTGGEHSGALHLTNERGWRRLFFDKGRYIGSTSSLREDRLGEVLWREGTIGLDQFIIASENMTPKKRLGRCLIELGYIGPGGIRQGLRTQARAIFYEACVMGPVHMAFIAGEKHPNPVMLLIDIDSLIDDAISQSDECARLELLHGPLTSPCEAVVPAPDGKLSENERAFLQLVTSAQKNKSLEPGQKAFSRHAAIIGSGLGKILGLRALAALDDGGYFNTLAPTAPAPVEARPPRINRLVGALNHVLNALDATGFGLTDEVRAFLDDPPEDVAEALSSISLEDGPLDAKSLREQAAFAGGEAAIERGLEVLLDFALFEARDFLPEAATASLHRSVAALDVIPM